MRCVWGCGAQLTGRQMRAHFTICPKRPASEYRDRRGRCLKVMRGRPPGRRILCGWRCATGAAAPDSRRRNAQPWARRGDLVDGLIRANRSASRLADASAFPGTNPRIPCEPQVARVIEREEDFTAVSRRGGYRGSPQRAPAGHQRA
jgi:hypothetical protein